MISSVGGPELQPAGMMNIGTHRAPRKKALNMVFSSVSSDRDYSSKTSAAPFCRHTKRSKVSTRRNSKDVSDSQYSLWNRGMNWSVGTAWRVFWSENKEYRSRQLRSGFEVHVEGWQFLGKGSVRLGSQLEEGITRLPHRRFRCRGAIHLSGGLNRQ